MSWLITYPSSTFLLVSSTISAFKLTASNADTASSFFIPTTFGTVVFSCPLLTITFIVVPSFTFLSVEGVVVKSPIVSPSTFWDIMYPSGTSLLYSSFSTANFNLSFSVSFWASSFDIPTKFGIFTSGGFVRFNIPIVPPKLKENNNIKPINMLNFLCFFINFFNFPSFLLPLLSSLSLFFTLLYISVLIICVWAVGSYSLSSTKSPFGFFKAFLKSTNISVADWYLNVVSFCNALIIILFTAIGTFLFTSIGSTGFSCICFNATDTGVSASNGTFPVTISYITTPKEYKSDFASVYPPRACSGEK